MAQAKRGLLASLIIFVFVITGCSDIENTGDNTVENTLLSESNIVSKKVVDEIDAATVLSIIKANIDANATNAFGIKAVKLIYKTQDVHGNDINASGMLYIPVVTQAYDEYLKEHTGIGFSISSILDNHGTIFLDAEAPTNVEVQNGLPDYLLSISATGLAGFALIAPDYVGYGASKGKTHPYIMKKSALASVDMLKAALAYMEEQGELLNYQVYVSGYSEGGYVAMEVARELEESYDGDIDFKGLAPMAGPYDVEGLGAYELNATKVMVVPAFLAYLADSYAKTYDDINISDLVVNPAPFTANALFTGDNNMTVIQVTLGLTTNGGYAAYTADSLFATNFINAYHSDNNNTVRVRFRENNVYDWTPRVKTNLIHCVNDEVIPYLLSTKKAYETLLANGADVITTDLNVSVATGQLVHRECGSAAYQKALEWFNAIRSGVVK